jgi:hypothetical protein
MIADAGHPLPGLFKALRTLTMYVGYFQALGTLAAEIH